MTGISLINKQKTSINVCYLIDVSPKKFTGGGQKHIVSIIRELKRSDLAAGSDLITFGGSNSNFFVRILWMLWVIPQALVHHFFYHRFNIIHAHSIPAIISGKVLSFILKVPLVVTIHGAWMKNGLERFILTHIYYDAQITVSRDFLEYQNINKPIYIPNGVDLRTFKGQTLRTQGLTLLSQKRILFVGRKDDPVKGFLFLQQAMRQVKKQIPDAQLIVAGGNIPQLELMALYKQADLFVLPSLSEGFPLTLLEAWAFKLPIVATSVGEIPHLIKDSVNGYLVPPGNVQLLAQTIVRAFKNPGLAKMGENGYNLTKRYTWKNAAQKTLRVYQKICSIS